MDLYYTVEPGKRWQDMTSYNSFILNNVKYYSEEFVQVANEVTIELQQAESDGKVDIINVVSVTGPVTVNQWIESDDEEITDELYWRQAYDCRTWSFPSECGKWMHQECMARNILMQVYGRLGTDKSHRTEGSTVEKKKPEEATDPLSPIDAEEQKTQSTVNVRDGTTPDNIHVKKAVRETRRKTESPTAGATPSKFIATASVKGLAKGVRKKKIADSKPYQGLFEANLKMQDGPTAWEIRDLRENVTGGDRTWTEEASCLECGANID
ncbi:hypothetical protein FOXG_14111 [Fusarium oxysporum f. sp. lycopersici 4287]|uniref:Uncharacterized protein n=2 Tax=Fusarium oxysporum TaxID=5507 RepID=A0A0J9VY17_FUSO4|nr:hypothetical protein FOXG_12426 [Fusarium oxysporum f. sp. lycopersici 4287]XP_018253701.1 hypothetical protein FOXG_14111 [Fusarium oxysporum f. sp. lycopersici 4287]KNB13663.1 hypothetical protein FOXG_12426 [Fusarium oxysporum f. sp. lycopersici 4287]KNB15656.1 hypothetical protein FOXG_14111 [Fusarium oxysporum f. sp. lycopersici 4287]